MVPKAKVVGVGSAFPPQVVDNDMLMPRIRSLHPGAPDREFCEKAFGVRTRRWSVDFGTGRLLPGCSDVDLADAAARRALEMAGVAPRDLDAVLHVTPTPDHLVDPDCAVELHARLGASIDCAALTFPTTCAGLVYGVHVARGLIASGAAKRVLLTATNVFSAIPERGWEFTFFAGDGASALVLAATTEEDESGIVGGCWGADRGEPGARFHYGTIGEPARAGPSVELLFNPTVKEGARLLTHATGRLAERYPGFVAALDWVVVHQANRRLQDLLAHLLRVPRERVPVNVEEYGNTMAASTGTILDRHVRDGLMKRGDRVAVVSVGTGWFWAAYLMRL